MDMAFACPYCELEFMQLACYALPWTLLANQQADVLYVIMSCMLLQDVPASLLLALSRFAM